MTGSHATLRERLLRSLVIDPSGCLLWTLSKDDKGYGQINVGHTIRKVHIVMWEMSEGPVPDGMELDHVKDCGCRYRHCASIAHLEPVTHRENLLRGESFSGVNAAKTHCPRLHPYDEAHTYVRANGRRECRECHRINEGARKRRIHQDNVVVRDLDRQFRGHR